MGDNEILDISNKIRPVINKGNCVVWIGAGLSSGIYSDWKVTIRHLCDACAANRLSPAEEESPSLLIKKAEECKSNNPNNYSNKLSELFGISKPTTRAIYQLMLQLLFKDILLLISIPYYVKQPQ